MILVIFLVVEGIFAASLSSLNHSYYLSFQNSDLEKAEPGDILGSLLPNIWETGEYGTVLLDPFECCCT